MTARKAATETRPDQTAASVRGFRTARGWSMRELARKSHVSQPMIWQIEAGGRASSDHVAGLLAAAFGVTLEDLRKGRCPRCEGCPAARLPGSGA